MSEILFDFLPFHYIIDEIKPHAARHHSEMNVPDDCGDIDVDWDLYEELSLAKQCYAQIARSSDGVLIGYTFFCIGSNPRHKTRIEASCQGTYVEREFRGSVGKNLIKKAVTNLQQMGCAEIEFVTNDPAYGKFLEQLGLIDTNYRTWSIGNG